MVKKISNYVYNWNPSKLGQLPPEKILLLLL